VRPIPVCQLRRDNPRIEKSSAPDVPATPPRTRLTGWSDRAADWIVPEKNPARVVYGLITVGALMAAESGRHESYADLVGSAFITTGLYWLLHAYSSVLGHRLATGERLTPAALSRGLAEEWAIVRGAAIPLLALLLAWATGASQETGVSAALWSAVVGLVLFELVAGVRSRASAGELALEVGLGIVMGLGILGLRVLLH
jgi:hypothetical protein